MYMQYVWCWHSIYYTFKVSLIKSGINLNAKTKQEAHRP